MRDAVGEIAGQVRAFSPRQWTVALLASAAAALVMGLPTDIVPNPFYRRMTPILGWDYGVLALSAVLTGLVLATFVRRVPVGASGGGLLGGGFLSFLAVGCPICNKLVVALIGVSGALTFFAPVQPYLALAGLVLLAVTLVLRLRAMARCRLQPVAERPY